MNVNVKRESWVRVLGFRVKVPNWLIQSKPLTVEQELEAQRQQVAGLLAGTDRLLSR